MSIDAIKNFAKANVSTGYNNLATSIVLATGTGAKFPNPATDGQFNLVWWDYTNYADPSDDPNVEIVRVTARNVDTLTIQRAQEGTAAANHNTAGATYRVILPVTAKLISDMKEEAKLVGTKSVDEASIGNNKVLIYNSTSGKVEYVDITAHNHDTAYYTKTALDAFFEGTLSGKKQVAWGSLTNVPATFTPTAHDHDAYYYTKTEADGKYALIHSHPYRADTWVPSWSEVTSKPSTFTPSAHTLDSHSNVTISANTDGEILRWNGTAWVNNTLAEANISAIHSHPYRADTWVPSWTDIASKPTTVSGFNISDAMTTAHAANAITGFGGNGAATTVSRSDHSHSYLSSSSSSTQSGYFGDIYLQDDSTPSHYLVITAGSNLTANRILTLLTGDAARTITISADVTLAHSTHDNTQVAHSWYTKASIEGLLTGAITTHTHAYRADTWVPDWSVITGKPSTFAPSAHTLDSHSNVTITTIGSGNILQWSGTEWVNRDLATAGISATHTHPYRPDTWVPDWSVITNIPSSFTPAAHTLDSHSNVTITSIGTGEILKWSGTAWINNTLAEAGISATHTHPYRADTWVPAWSEVTSKPSTFTPAAHTLDSHSNVTITSNADGEILRWNGTAWVNNTLAEAGISATHTHPYRADTWVPTWTEVTSKPTTFAPAAHTLDSHSNVTITTIASGELLAWNGTAWINQTLAEAGISATHTHPYRPDTWVPSWTDVTSKPSTFTPPIATGSVLGGVKQGSNVTIDANGVISVAAPYTHPTGDGNLHVPATSTTNNLKVLKAGSTAGSIAWGNVDWSELTSKPATFTATAHNHAWSEITSKPTSAVTDIDDAVTKRHSQNTDTGTSSAIFQIGGGVKLKNSSGVLELRNAADSAWADLVCNSITVKTTVTVEAETVTIADNVMLLNSNYSGSTPTENAGLEVERGTLTHASLLWDETNDRWMCGLLASEGYIFTNLTAPATATRWPTFAEVTSKPTDLAGYGITDAAPSSHVGATGAAHGVVTGSVNGFMIAADKTKLDGIATSANNYSHPTGDGNLHVPATSTTNNLKVLKAGSTAGSIAWGNVDWSELTNKPSSFTPAAHDHAWSDITSGIPTYATRWADWTEVTNKPATFTPSAHTLDSHSNVVITSNASGEILKWNGTQWINNTLAEAGIEPAITKSTGYLYSNGSAWSFKNEAYSLTSHTHDYSASFLSSSTSSTQTGYFGDIKLKDDSTPSHYLAITAGSNLTADRILTINTGDASRTLTISADVTLAHSTHDNTQLAHTWYTKASIEGLLTGTITSHDHSGTYLTGNQTITLSGDISGSGSTAITTSIGANKVTLAMMAQMATASFLGRNTALTGDVEVLSVATAQSMLGLGSAAYTESTAYEAAITKATGYAKWNGSAWAFVNETYMQTSHSANAITGFGGNGTATTVSRSDHSHSYLSSSTSSTQAGYFGDIYLRDDTNSSHYMIITNASDYTANRTLSIVTGDASRTLTISANVTLAHSTHDNTQVAHSWYTKASIEGLLTGAITTHTHAYRADTWVPDWTDVTNKPSSFTPAAHNHTIKLPYTWAIPGEIKVPSGDTDFVVPFYIPGNSGAKIVACKYKINSGTSATVKLQKNGVDITGFTAISVTTTAGSTDPADVTLADGDQLALVVTAVSGTPKNLTFTIYLEYTV